MQYISNECPGIFLKVKDRLIGEAIVWFDELNLIREPQFTLQLQLEPRTDINVRILYKDCFELV